MVCILQPCPANFKPVAGGECANFPSPPPSLCPDQDRNGDVNGDNVLTVDDLDQIALHVLSATILTDCAFYAADGMDILAHRAQNARIFKYQCPGPFLL